SLAGVRWTADYSVSRRPEGSPFQSAGRRVLEEVRVRLSVGSIQDCSTTAMCWLSPCGQARWIRPVLLSGRWLQERNACSWLAPILDFCRPGIFFSRERTRFGLRDLTQLS